MAKRKGFRFWVQLGSALLANGYLTGFVQGRLYQGKLKQLCFPGLNCYSCPGALGSCPIGSLQAVMGSRKFQFSFYVTGFLILVGALFGRLICGFLCPFGFLQDLLFKIPFVKKLQTFRGDRILRLFKYLILLLFVLLGPLFLVDIVGIGEPAFCKYICPAGTLQGGIPLVLFGEGMRDAIGFLFAWKMAILAALLLLSVLLYRPFCKYLCPLGAVYALFNRISLWRYRLKEDRCTQCGRCVKACGMGLKPFAQLDSMECIRCGKCAAACPEDAVVFVRNPFTGKAEIRADKRSPL